MPAMVAMLLHAEVRRVHLKSRMCAMKAGEGRGSVYVMTKTSATMMACTASRCHAVAGRILGWALGTACCSA